MVLARVLIVLGLVLLALGGIVYLLARLGLQPGRLPGDIRIQSGGITCVFPLVTSILLSILLTVILNVIVRFLNR
jgi:hypothetical protein